VKNFFFFPCREQIPPLPPGGPLESTRPGALFFFAQLALFSLVQVGGKNEEAGGARLLLHVRDDVRMGFFTWVACDGSATLLTT